MIDPADVARYIYRQGIFVIGQSVDGISILKDSRFQLKVLVISGDHL
jgi:hypothetical protein